MIRCVGCGCWLIVSADKASVKQSAREEHGSPHTRARCRERSGVTALLDAVEAMRVPLCHAAEWAADGGRSAVPVVAAAVRVRGKR